jgi:hypothetical protein
MKNIEAAKNILDIAKESRNKFAVTGTEFDKVQANMYSVFECYAHGVISWDTTKKYFQESIKKYLSLHKGNMLKEERASMKEEYKRIVVEYKIALDEYKKVNEQKLSNKLLKHVGFIGESAAQAQSKKYYNERALTESELKDTTSLSWERVMEAYPNLTTKDEDRIRMLTIFEGPTLDTTQMITTVMKEDDINFNPNAGHMDQPSHPQNKGLTKRSTSPRPKLRPKNFDQIVQRAGIQKALQQAMGEGYKELPPINRDRYQERDGLEGPFSTLSGKVVYYDPKEGAYYDPDTDMYMSYDEFRKLDDDYKGMEEGHSPHPKGSAKYKKHMAAMHAGMNEEMSDDEVDAFHRELDKIVHKHLGHSSDEVDERKMTKSEKAKEERLKDKYDDSDMKASMKKQYGDDWESVYYATIRKQAMSEWNGDDQYQAVENFIGIALDTFEQMLDNGEDELRARAKAHDYLKGELGDLGVTHGDIESKEYHGMLEKEIIQIMNRRDKGMREGHAPDHNMQARMRLMKILNKAIEDSKKKRGIEDEKDRTDETVAGAIAGVAQPLGKMQRRKKTDEAHPNSKVYDKCWDGYEKVPGKKRGEPGSCRKKD